MLINERKNMKNKSLLLLILLASVACTQEPLPEGTGRLTVDLDGIAATKAIIGATAAEMQVKTLNLYVFDANGMLDLSHACTEAEIGAKKAVMNVKTGSKTVYALANFRGNLLSAANGKATRTELEQVPIGLGDNSTTEGLLMTASGNVMVSSGSGGQAALTLSRPVARVALCSVTNKLPAPYGTVKVLRAFLCNVAGNQNVAGDAATTVWYNQNATNDNVAAHVIGTSGHAAQLPALTYADLNEDVTQKEQHPFSNRFFYAFPNARTNPNNGHTSPFSPTATVLMVVVQIRNVPYYYPVVLEKKLESNKDYKVDLTLIGLGNTEDDPFKKIEKADLTATVSVSDWTTGATYTESI